MVWDVYRTSPLARRPALTTGCIAWRAYGSWCCKRSLPLTVSAAARCAGRPWTLRRAPTTSEVSVSLHFCGQTPCCPNWSRDTLPRASHSRQKMTALGGQDLNNMARSGVQNHIIYVKFWGKLNVSFIALPYSMVCNQQCVVAQPWFSRF